LNRVDAGASVTRIMGRRRARRRGPGPRRGRRVAAVLDLPGAGDDGALVVTAIAFVAWYSGVERQEAVTNP
jgi:hypothetical protein